MMNEHDHENGHDHDDEHDHEHDLAMELTTQSQIFLEMRRQNLELLDIAVKVAGLGKDHPPLKPADVRGSLKTIWEIYAEFYTWVDPEESGDEEDEADEEFEEIE